MHAIDTPAHGPRYPSAERFTSTFGYRDYLHAVAGLRTRGSNKVLALYLHIPVRDKSPVYLSYLKREIEMQGRLFAGMNQVEQLHMGGGSPACLSDSQMADLMRHLRRWFQFAADGEGEYAIAVDPRSVTGLRVHSLRRQGFNRISIRLTPEHDTAAIIAAARAATFRSVAIDLTYGLPAHTLDTLGATLAQVIEADPDRIAVCDQSRAKPRSASTDASRAMLSLCITTLTAAGYLYIGMDQFVKPEDDLAIAQRQGRLHRNCQGYTTHADMDLVACGVSAISSVAATYSQNATTLAAYYDLIDRNELPIVRGMALNMDDALRRTIILMLMCQFELSISAIELAYPLAFSEYFAAELTQLALLEADDLVTIEDEWITVTAKGRLMIRKVCMVFERSPTDCTAWMA